MKIGENIRKIRMLKGYSQEYIASLLKISQRSFSKIERNEVNITWDRIQEISKILEVDINVLKNFSNFDIFDNLNQEETDIDKLIKKQFYKLELELQNLKALLLKNQYLKTINDL
ncbi:MAG: helix-turn-helix transcriptional regulator [Chlorobi bacterium]|nr:helix-turn-helix transcriptional regulator [Chlorobiota bacterium]